MAPLRSTSIRRGPRQICIKPDWLREQPILLLQVFGDQKKNAFPETVQCRE